MNKTKIWVGVLALFAAGVIVGALGGIMYSRYDFQKRFENFHKMPVKSIARVILDKIDHEVTLSAQQRREIEPLILAGAQKADKTMESTKQKMRQHLQDLFSQIKTKLTPEQQTKFDQAVGKGLFQPPGPPPPGGKGPMPPPMEPGHGPPPPMHGDGGPWQQPPGPPPPPSAE